MNLLNSLLSHLGLTSVHASLAEAAIGQAPSINPTAPHEDWHAYAVDKFKQVTQTMTGKAVEHWVANALIGFMFGALRKQLPAAAAPVVDAAAQAATTAVNSAIEGKPTVGEPLTPMQAILAAPTSIRPQAPTTGTTSP